MGETKGCVTGDRALAVQNFRHAVGRNIDLSRQFRRAHLEFGKLFGQLLAGMDYDLCHNELMVVNDFNILRAIRPFWPLKTDTPLIVNANTVLARSISRK